MTRFAGELAAAWPSFVLSERTKKLEVSCEKDLLQSFASSIFIVLLSTLIVDLVVSLSSVVCGGGCRNHGITMFELMQTFTKIFVLFTRNILRIVSSSK